MTSAVLSSLGLDAYIISVYLSVHLAPRGHPLGLHSTFLDLEHASDEDITSAFRRDTKLVWIDGPTNTTLQVVDIPRIPVIIKRRWREGRMKERLDILVDNTFLSPFYASPLLQGADMVLLNLTKNSNGHSDLAMGALIPCTVFLEPTRTGELRSSKTLWAPFHCFLSQHGAKTFALWIQMHSLTALAVVRAAGSYR